MRPESDKRNERKINKSETRNKRKQKNKRRKKKERIKKTNNKEIK